MYKEYRDISLNGAVSQMHMEMAGNHRASEDTISIIRTAVLNEKDNIRRSKTHLLRENGVKFPILRSLSRASNRKYHRIFKANRPNTFRQWLFVFKHWYNIIDMKSIFCWSTADSFIHWPFSSWDNVILSWIFFLWWYGIVIVLHNSLTMFSFRMNYQWLYYWANILSYLTAIRAY